MEARNVMTWATILLAVSAVLGTIVDVFPASEGLGLAKAAIIAGAAGRAFVFASKEIAGIYQSGEVVEDDSE
jgi:hypothetical protein